MHNSIMDSLIILDDEISDPKEQTEGKRNNKRSTRPDTSRSPRAKRPRLQSPIVSQKSFRKSESFDLSEFLSWLKSNRHLCTIEGDTVKICEFLYKVRIENPSINKIFLPLVENGEEVNPHFFRYRTTSVSERFFYFST